MHLLNNESSNRSSLVCIHQALYLYLIGSAREDTNIYRHGSIINVFVTLPSIATSDPIPRKLQLESLIGNNEKRYPQQDRSHP